MKYIRKIFLLLMLICFLFAFGCGNNEYKKIETSNKIVYTSFYPMYDFAKKVAGDKYEIINMMPVGMEPHDWEPTAADITKLEQADYFIFNGAGMEHWVDDVLDTLENKNLIVIETSKGIPLIQNQNLNSDKHIHNDIYDSHVWLSPLNAKKQMETIKNAFVEYDFENKDYFEENFSFYADEFDKLHEQFKETFSEITNKAIVVAHEAYGYLCAEYGITQISIEGFSSEAEPSPARMVEVIKFVKENDVKTIFFEELVSPKVAKIIADEVGIETAVLDPIEGLSEKQIELGEDYFSIMKQNLRTLKKTLQ